MKDYTETIQMLKEARKKSKDIIKAIDRSIRRLENLNDIEDMRNSGLDRPLEIQKDNSKKK